LFGTREVNRMPFTSLIQFKVKPGEQTAFEAAFVKTGMLTRPKSVAGFLGAELIQSNTSTLEYCVVGKWETEQSYTDWQAIATATTDVDALSDLIGTLVDPAPGQLFRTVHSSLES